NPARGADVRERDLRQLAGRVREDADRHAFRLEPAQRRARLGARPEVDRAPVGGEPLEKRSPVAEQLVERARSLLAVLGDVQLAAVLALVAVSRGATAPPQFPVTV